MSAEEIIKSPNQNIRNRRQSDSKALPVTPSIITFNQSRDQDENDGNDDGSEEKEKQNLKDEFDYLAVDDDKTENNIKLSSPLSDFVFDHERWKEENEEEEESENAKISLNSIDELRLSDSVTKSHKNVVMPSQKFNKWSSPTPINGYAIGKTQTIDVRMIDDSQIIENVLRSTKCWLCCDLQIGLTICFIWLIMCCIPTKNIMKHWIYSLLSLLQAACLTIGVIGIWRAQVANLYLSMIAIVFNICIMIGVAILVLAVCKVDDSQNDWMPHLGGHYLPPFIIISQSGICTKTSVWVTWAFIVSLNLSLECWILWIINKAIATIHKTNEETASHDILI